MGHPFEPREALRKCRSPRLRIRTPLVCSIIALILGGCDPLSLTALGVGAAYGVQHTLSGISYRTFSVPLPQVRSAVMSALHHMDIKVAGKEKIENGERFTARAADREIEVELEAITPKTTRMRSTARSGFVRDAATATEIILQTERLLTSTEVTSR
jgi:hypothetical protein